VAATRSWKARLCAAWAYVVAPLLVLLSVYAFSLCARGIYCCDHATFHTITWDLVKLLDGVRRLVTWPMAFLVAFMITASSGALRYLPWALSRFRSVKLFGSEITFTEEGAKLLATSADEAFRLYKQEADVEIARQVEAHNVSSLVRQVFKSPDSHAPVKSVTEKSGFRATVHITDVLFQETLYQLIDYFPTKSHGAARRFSIRYGILGRCWRLAEHQGGANVATTDRALITEFGMTAEEIESKSRRKPAYLCVLLRQKSSGLPIAVLYMDSEESGAFGKSEPEWLLLAKHVEADCERVGLSTAIDKVVQVVQKYQTRIGIQG
jgi:hypothetical protein